MNNGASINPSAPPDDVRSVASGVRWRVLFPLLLTMIFLVGAFITLFILETKRRDAEDLARTAASVENLFEAQSAEAVQVMRTIIELVMRDRTLEAAYRAGDRRTLLALSEPILREIRARNDITHFYYILPDRAIFLRVHVPDKHGDVIERFGLQEAQRTGQPYWGNEQGPYGSLTLRVTYPWIVNGETLGYLEMGIEFEDIMRAVQHVLDVDVFVAIDKKFLDHAKWKQMQKQMGKSVDWNEFPSVLVLSRTKAAIPAPISTHLAGLKEHHVTRAFEIAWDQRVAEAIALPFNDLRGRELGELVVLRDITAAAKTRHRDILLVAALGTLAGGGLVAFFYVLLGRVQRDVAGRTARLTEAQQVLTTARLERQRAESEHKQSLEISRQAGMAEVATNVLHNVGNVLNSVNISASMAIDSVKTSKVSHLAKVAALVREHEDALGTFFTSDSRGKQLPAYLAKLSEHLLASQKAAVQELNSLLKNIGHIKEIVSMQQGYARVSGIREITDIRELAEDALRMNIDALNRQQVEVIREFQDVPLISIDRHTVLQILVNLIRNAKHACQDSGRAAKQLTMRVANGDGRIKISVRDNGVGIPPENLTRIFSHGFTTRKDGHGFGLHSGALAAKALGGSLTVHSDGPGEGAAFTLELPIPQQPAL